MDAILDFISFVIAGHLILLYWNSVVEQIKVVLALKVFSYYTRHYTRKAVFGTQRL